MSVKEVSKTTSVVQAWQINFIAQSFCKVIFRFWTIQFSFPWRKVGVQDHKKPGAFIRRYPIFGSSDYLEELSTAFPNFRAILVRIYFWATECSSVGPGFFSQIATLGISCCSRILQQQLYFIASPLSNKSVLLMAEQLTKADNV